MTKTRTAVGRWLGRRVRLRWIHRHKNQSGIFIERSGDARPCIVRDLEESPFMDDAIRIDYEWRQGCWVYGATIGRSAFKPNV